MVEKMLDNTKKAHTFEAMSLSKAMGLKQRDSMDIVGRKTFFTKIPDFITESELCSIIDQLAQTKGINPHALLSGSTMQEG
jgi:hypothetical protein